MSDPVLHLLDVMTRAALSGAETLKEARRRGPEWVAEKGHNDYLTSADKASEAAVKAVLGAGCPDIPMLAEEGSGAATGREGRFFCVDPLDGTNNFVHHLPIYCVSVGLVEAGRAVLGVVCDPVHDEVFRGGEGVAAEMNGSPIRTSGRTALDGAFVATGFPFKELDHVDHYVRGFRNACVNTGGIRRCGAAALDLVWTACGRFDGFWERGLYPWDVAAGAAILRAAGGALSDFAGGEDYLFGRTVVAGASEPIARALRDFVG